MIKTKKIAKVGKGCVACGSCLKTCPVQAIHIANGVKAKINIEKCVGCGKCSKICPASVIEIISCEVNDEK